MESYGDNVHGIDSVMDISAHSPYNMFSSFFLSILNLSSTHSGSRLCPPAFSCTCTELLPTSSSSSSSLSRWASLGSGITAEPGSTLVSKSGCRAALMAGTGELSSALLVAIAGLSPCQCLCVCVRGCVHVCDRGDQQGEREKGERGARNTPCVFSLNSPPPSLNLVHKSHSFSLTSRCSRLKGFAAMALQCADVEGESRLYFNRNHVFSI